VNENIRELMLKAGYAAPELAGRANKLVELLVRDCGRYLNSPEFVGRSDLDWAMVLNEHFGVGE